MHFSCNAIHSDVPSDMPFEFIDRQAEPIQLLRNLHAGMLRGHENRTRRACREVIEGRMTSRRNRFFIAPLFRKHPGLSLFPPQRRAASINSIVRNGKLADCQGRCRRPLRARECVGIRRVPAAQEPRRERPPLPFVKQFGRNCDCLFRLCILGALAKAWQDRNRRLVWNHSWENTRAS